MSEVRHGGPVARLLVLALGFLSLATAPAGIAKAAPSSRVTIMMHLQGGPSPNLPVTASQLRGEALSLLETLAGAHDLEPTARAAADDLVRRHRLRSGASLTPEALAELADAGITSLLAVSIVCEPHQLAVSARLVDTGSGCLRAIGRDTAALGSGSWQQALARALGAAFPAASATAAATGQKLLVLPTRTVGFDAQAARTATANLLAMAIADGGWSVVDPALATGITSLAGHDLEALDAAARTLLRERFGVTCAIVPELVSFGFASGATDVQPGVDASAGASRPTADLTFALHWLDLRTGRIRSATSVMVSGEPVQGWFGTVRQTTEPLQIKNAATELWARFRHVLEEQTS